MSVNPAETRVFALLAARAAHQTVKSLSELTIDDFRSGADIFLEFAGLPAAVSQMDYHVPVRDGASVRVRMYNADLNGPGPVLIMYPGCGYIIDLFEANAIGASRIAAYSGIRVVMVDFRLAPEYPLPAAIYDGYDVTQYLAERSEQFGIDRNRLFIGGLSSGAHCAAAIAGLARRETSFTVYHQVLLNGMFDLTASNRAYETYESQDQMCVRARSPYIFKYYGISPADYALPVFSPYFEPDLSGMPPTTFVISEYDGLRSDSEAYHERFRQAGLPVQKILLPGQSHNTFIMRGAMSDGEDPAKVIAEVIKGLI